jgi:hypothetical protein
MYRSTRKAMNVAGCVSSGKLLLLLAGAPYAAPTISHAQRSPITISQPHAVLRPAGVWVIREGSAFDAAEIAPNGDVALAHGDPTLVEIFDRAGRRRYTLPRPGDSLMAVPTAHLASMQDGRLAIADQRRALIFLYNSRETAALPNTVAGPSSVSGICALGGSLALYTAERAGRLELMRPGQRTFSPIVHAVGRTRPRIQESLNEAKLVCLVDRDELLVVGVLVPTAALFTVRGDVKWRTELAAIRRVDVVTSDTNVVTYRTLADGYQKLIRATRLSPSIVALQWVTLSRQNHRWGDPGPIETRFLDLTTGREVSRSRNVPEILAARDGELLVADHARRAVTRHRFTLNIQRPRSRE